MRASQARMAPPIKMNVRPFQLSQDVPTATNAESASITQEAAHQMVKIALQKTDWFGIAPLCKSAGHQIGPGLEADLPGLCGLRCRAQAQLKFDPVRLARPTCQVVFVVRNTGLQHMRATSTRALCSRLACIAFDRNRLPSRLLNGLLNPLANFCTAARVSFLSVGLVARVRDTDQGLRRGAVDGLRPGPRGLRLLGDDGNRAARNQANTTQHKYRFA